MYNPAHFDQSEWSEISDLIRSNPLGTLISVQDGSPFISHLPILLEEKTLIGHMARANPHWKLLTAGVETTVIFHGPDLYISPKLYKTAVNVPTWNYAVVHARGRAKLIEGYSGIHEVLEKTVNTFEAGSANPWNFVVPEDYKTPRIAAIVAFHIEIEHVEAKFKLNQNRPDVDRRAVIEHLETRSDESARSMLAIMKRMDARIGLD